MFTSTVGTPLDERNVRREFQALLERAELPPMRIHDLRHTTATLLLAQGVHPRIVMDTLGHSQVSLTLDTYSHVLPGLQAEAAARLDDALAIGRQNGRQGAESPSREPEDSTNSGEKVVTLTFASWNHIAVLLRGIDELRLAA